MLKNKLGWLVLCILLFSFSATQVLAASVPHFNDPGFKATWERIDKPVDDLHGNAGRSYTWGPPAPDAVAITQEAYNGITRTVQYFDKARMEVNNPAVNPNDPYYVTTGLLVKEMVSGLRQDGDTTFTQFSPSTNQVAGDSNANGANAVAPTYASFAGVATIDPTKNNAAAASGKLINQSIDKSGKVQTITPPEQRLFDSYSNVTNHNIADIFAQIAYQNGIIWDGSSYVSGNVFFRDPFYMLGLPITEPYWTHAVVNGAEKDVLVQLFERRVLTYTPSNPPAFQVEMGNVGQHYYKWRYIDNHTPSVKLADGLVTSPIVAGSYVFWTEGDKETTIHGYNLEDKTQFVVPDTGKAQFSLSSDGNQLVWLQSPDQYLSPGSTIQLYDIASGKRITVLDRGVTADFDSLALDNGTLYYQDSTQGHQGLFARNLTNGQERLVTDKGSKPVVANGAIVWVEVGPEGKNISPIYSLHLLKPGATKDIILTSEEGAFSSFSIKGNQVIWSHFPGAITQKVYVYDISADKTTSISSGAGRYPQLTSHGAVWVNPDVAPFPTIYYDFKTQVTKPIMQDISGITLWGVSSGDALVYSGGDGLYYREIS